MTVETPIILVVEDETKIAQLICDYLHAANFQTVVVADGAEVMAQFQAVNPALVLLDIMLPNKNGIDLCRDLRQISNVPIIMVTAKVEEIDRILGLELGANDYVCKPFSPRELVARVKANVRAFSVFNTSSEEEPTRSNPLSSLVVDEDQHSAQLDGQVLNLTPVEFRILTAMHKQPQQAWSRERLLRCMYDDHRTVSDRTVDSHMANLRRKLQQLRPESEAIRSIYGVGYKLEL